MTTERKKWWRKVAMASVGGTVVVGGLFGIVRATAPPEKKPLEPLADDTAWTRAPAPTPAPAPAPPAPLTPAVAAVERSEIHPGTESHPGSVIPASAALAIPLPTLPAIPAGPAPAPVAPPAPSVPPVPLTVPPVPVPAGVEPIGAGPRNPDVGVIAADKVPLPSLPALPSVELPKVPAAPKAPESAPAAPMTVVPPVPAPGALPPLPTLPGATAEPPKASTPVVPTMPVVPPALPGTPVPQPPEVAPIVPPVKSTEPVQPMLPVKPDSGLNPPNPQNTLNPPSAVAPAAPVGLPGEPPRGRETPGTTVDRPKPADPSFGSTEKFVFPVPAGSNPLVATPRDPAMMNLKHAAAVAVLGGAMLSAEQARSAALVPSLPPVNPVVPMAPAAPVSADDKETVDKLKKDLETANDKIKALEKQVAKLSELLTGKKDSDGTVLTSDPGAVEDIKRLRNRIADLEGEIKTLKTQTALKPAVVTPEAKPKGVVRVVNEYPVEISMVINDKSHRIAPNTKLDVEVPAGDFSYQLLQSGAPATRSVIKDKETVTLRIK